MPLVGFEPRPQRLNGRRWFILQACAAIVVGNITFTIPVCYEEKQLSRYSDGLWVVLSGIYSRQEQASRPILGPTQSPIQWVPGALSPGVKLPERKADHPPPTSAEVKKMWIYTSTFIV
jgi:hypothetical protein